jgi:hypothetical protein
MKIALLAFLGISLFGGAAWAQEAKFESLTIDYGTIAQGSDGVRVVTFKNIGDKALYVTQVASNCGCLVPTWTFGEAAPGATLEFKIKYDTMRVGQFTKYLTVHSNDSGSPERKIAVKGNVLPPGSAPDPVK